jgi:hypothetical protein
MEIFDIPFNPDAAHGWTVPIPRDGEKRFVSRADALAFVQMLAKDESISQRTKTISALNVTVSTGGCLRPI